GRPPGRGRVGPGGGAGSHGADQGAVRSTGNVQPGDLRGRHVMARIADGDARNAGAFDPVRPPRRDLLDACVHCGFCLPTCPTYVLWSEEMDSPRGRIVLMRDGLEAGSEMTRSLVTHLDRCLGCMACVTA